MRLRKMLPLVAATMLAAPTAAQADFMHTVMRGESLTSIAATDGLSVGQLAAANGISPFTRLIAGSTLAIPPKSAPASTTARTSTRATSVCDGDDDADDVGCSTASAGSTPSAGGSYVVRRGDTLTGIAARAGTTVSALAALNGLNPSHFLLYGRVLRLPGGSTMSASSVASSGSGGSYVVRRGDTLSGIAARAGTTVSALAALNGLNPKHYLLYGTVLRLPGASTMPASSVASSEPVGASAVGSLNAPPYPTPQRVTAGQIGSIASANGVPPSFAEAIGWQESGFQNGVVSSVGARGVMQILPGTWNWIGSVLNRGGIPLAPASALDNVRGGVIMLHALLNATGGNEADAAAGYYQGLSSVQQHGFFSDTKQYVRDVLALNQRFGGG